MWSLWSRRLGQSSNAAVRKRQFSADSVENSRPWFSRQNLILALKRYKPSPKISIVMSSRHNVVTIEAPAKIQEKAAPNPAPFAHK